MICKFLQVDIKWAMVYDIKNRILQIGLQPGDCALRTGMTTGGRSVNGVPSVARVHGEGATTIPSINACKRGMAPLVPR